MSVIKKTVTSILIIIVFTLGSKFLGFFREILIASKFGSGMESDTYFVALTATSIATDLIWIAISTTLIPIFIEIEHNEGFEHKLKHANNMINIILIVTILLTVIGWAVTPIIIKFIAMGFEKKQFDLAVLLTRIGLPKLLFSGSIGILIAFLNSEQKFKSTSSIYIFANLIYIVYLLFFSDKYGIYGLMVASFLSVVIQLLVLLPEAIKVGYKYERLFDIKDKYLQKLCILVLPVLLGTAMNDINVIIDRAIASSLTTGSISALNYANKINGLVLSVLITAITTVIFPILSKKSSSNNIMEMKKIMGYEVNIILLITIPAAVGLVMLAKPIVEVAFQRGAFNSAATLMTSQSLIFYSVGLVSMALRLLFTEVYYSIQDTKTPMINAFVSILLNIALNLILVRTMAHSGLALATSIANTVAVILLAYELKKKIGPLGTMSYIICGLKAATASIPMGVVVFITYNKLITVLRYSNINNLLSLLAVAAIGVLVYLTFCYILRVSEIYIIINKGSQVFNRFIDKRKRDRSVNYEKGVGMIMKKVITYGTFDLFHYGHFHLLKRAKELGDYLIIGVTTESFDKQRGKLNVHDSLMDRILNIMNSGLADKIIIEEYEGQKIDDIQKYGVDIFTVGSDWEGKFDYLNEYCKVIYLDRTRGISSTQLRNQDTNIIKLGIIGSNRIAKCFVDESKYVSGVHVESVFDLDRKSAQMFAEDNELNSYTDDLNMLCSNVDAVYIASHYFTSFENIKLFLNNGKHVMCKIPFIGNENEVRSLFNIANGKKLVLLGAIKTAYCPAFAHLVTLVKSGAIGKIKDVDVSYTSLNKTNEMDIENSEYCITELLSCALFPIIKLLGTNYLNVKFYSAYENEAKFFTRGIVEYAGSSSGFNVGWGIKTEETLIITGTKGYVYVPAPWFKTEYFELRFEDLNNTRKYFYKFDGDGFRYELGEFINNINSKSIISHKLSQIELIAISKVIEQF